MAEWFQAGYFTMSLLVKRGCDEVFQALGEIMKIWGRVPFTPGPAPPPLQVCFCFMWPVCKQRWMPVLAVTSRWRGISHFVTVQSVRRILYVFIISFKTLPSNLMDFVKIFHVAVEKFSS